MGRLAVVMKNRSFIKLLIVFLSHNGADGLSCRGFLYLHQWLPGWPNSNSTTLSRSMHYIASIWANALYEVVLPVSVQKVISGCFALLAIAGIFTLTVGGFCLLGSLCFIPSTSDADGYHHAVPNCQQCWTSKIMTRDLVALIQFFSMIVFTWYGLVSIRLDSLIENPGLYPIIGGNPRRLDVADGQKQKYVTKKLN